VWIVLWFSLALLLLSVTLAGIYCFRSGRALWRTMNSLGAALDVATVGLTDAAATASERSARLEKGLHGLDVALARLRTSLQRWSVLMAAVQDVRSSLAAVYPRK
jgi:hypothetical protein